MSKKIVSVAIATYNGSVYLEEQLLSISKQTIRPDEVVLVDDCSLDSTIKIAQKFNEILNINIHINEKSLGCVKNFEKAISLCTGDLILLSDQDDVWEPNKIELLISSIGDNWLVHTNAKLIDPNGNELSSSFDEYSMRMTTPKELGDLVFNGLVTGCTACITRELVDLAIPFPEGIDPHDRWLGIVAFSFGKIAYIDEPLIKYRQHFNNRTGASLIERSIFKHIIRGLRNKSLFRIDKSFIEKASEDKNLLQGISCIYPEVVGSNCNKIKKFFNSLDKKDIMAVVYCFFVFRYLAVGKPLFFRFVHSFNYFKNVVFWVVFNRGV